MKKEKEKEWSILSQIICLVFVSLGIISTLNWAINLSTDEGTTNKIKDLERKVSTIECEFKGGKLNIYTLKTDYLEAWGYYEGADDYCEKEGLRYYWKDGNWVNQETKILK